MKKVFSLLLAMVIVASCLMLTACDKGCDHTYGNWTTTKTATCTEDGQKERTCSECGETDTQAIKAPGHDYVDGVCTECGASK